MQHMQEGPIKKDNAIYFSKNFVIGSEAHTISLRKRTHRHIIANVRANGYVVLDATSPNIYGLYLFFVRLPLDIANQISQE